MALIKCKECGKDISSNATSCPKCGIVLKQSPTSNNDIIIKIVTIIIGVIIAIIFAIMAWFA